MGFVQKLEVPFRFGQWKTLNSPIILVSILLANVAGLDFQLLWLAYFLPGPAAGACLFFPVMTHDMGVTCVDFFYVSIFFLATMQEYINTSAFTSHVSVDFHSVFAFHPGECLLYVLSFESNFGLGARSVPEDGPGPIMVDYSGHVPCRLS